LNSDVAPDSDDRYFVACKLQIEIGVGWRAVYLSHRQYLTATINRIATFFIKRP